MKDLPYGNKIGLTIVIHVDNMGALFMETNGPEKCTKHVDIHHHFIQQYIEYYVINILFIPIDDNKEYGFTKNNPGEKFDKHNGTFMFRGVIKS